MVVGDIILTHDKGFLPSAIRFFMKRYAKRIGVKTNKFYNHVAICVEVNGKLLIAESMAKGVQITKTPDEFFKHRPDYLIRTWINPLTEDESRRLSEFVTGISLRITRYDYKNFIDQIGLVVFNEWNGKTGDDANKVLYCSELAAYAMDYIRGIFGGVWWTRNPLDIQINNELKDE